MDKRIIKGFGAELSDYFTVAQFLEPNIPVYTFKVGKDIRVYMSQCDFHNGENLIDKDLIDLYIHKNRMRVLVKIPKTIVSETQYIYDLIKESI